MVLVPPGRSPSVGACGGGILIALSNLPHCLHERCIHYSHSDFFQMLAANCLPVEEGLGGEHFAAVALGYWLNSSSHTCKNGDFGFEAL